MGSCIFAVPADKINKDQRYATKKIAHGTHYDEFPQRISDSLLKDGFYFTVEECAAGQGRYLSKFPAIRDSYQYRSRLLVVVNNARKLTNSWGRTIYFPHERFEPALYRRLYAWRASSEIADLLNQWGFIAAVQFCDKYNLKSRVNLQVHDEVAISTDIEEGWDLMRMLRDSLERAREYEGESLVVPVTFALENRYHAEQIEFKKFPADYQEYKNEAEKVWANRIA